MDNMDEQTINNLGQVAGENVQQQLANMDVSNRQIWTKVMTRMNMSAWKKKDLSNWPCDKYDHYIPTKVEGMMASMTESLEGDLDQMMNALQEAVANNQVTSAITIVITLVPFFRSRSLK